MNDKIHPALDTVHFWFEKMQTNIHGYLLRGKKIAIIDTGPPLAPDILLGSFEKHKVRPEDIDFILNTHGHFDHIGNNSTIKEAGTARIMIHEQDAIFIDDPGRAFDLLFAPISRAMGREQNIHEDRAAFIKEVPVQVAIDRRLKDNDLIEIGDGIDLKVLHIPGHTPGSVGYFWEKEGILFAGDSVQGLNGPGGMLPIIYDLASYEESIRRLMKIPINCIMQCHPYRGLELPPETVRQGDEVRQFLEDSLMVVDHLKKAVKRHIGEKDRPLKELADLIIAELPKEMDFGPLDQVPAPQFSLMTIVHALSRSADRSQ